MRALDRSTSSSSVGELDQPSPRPSVDGRTSGIGGFDLQRVAPQRSSPRDDNAPQARTPGNGLILANARLLPQATRGAPNGEGCGLGLAIVREIAERHGGTATLLPAAPHGCIARLTLPAG